MSGIFGALNLADTDRAFVNTIGQRVVYDAVQQIIERHNADLQDAYSVFVDEETSDFKRRFKLPGGGYLQRRGGSGQSAAVKAFGEWDVAFPLEDFGAQFSKNDIAVAYMTVQELNRHLLTIFAQDINTMRREILVALLNNTAWTFTDLIHGALSVQPLANGDAVLYPPVLGSDAEATDTHYLESGYASTSINDNNNPFVTIRNELEEHFGVATGGENIAVFINPDEVSATEALTDFDPVNDKYVIPGANVDQLTGLPANVPGRVIGRTNGCWVIEWRWIPSGYMVGIYMEPGVPKPLIKRNDPADTGLTTGLTLVVEDEIYPFKNAHYRHRYGLGVGNRLNGVVMELANGAGYTVPAAYAR